MAGYLANRDRGDDKFWRDGAPGGVAGAAGGAGATPGGAADGYSEGGPRGSIAVGGAYGAEGSDGRSGVYGAGGYQSNGDGGGAAGAGYNDAETDAEKLDKADYRGGGGAKRNFGDLDESDGPQGWTTRGGITKRKKTRKRSDDGSVSTPLRSQKELYVDYDKLAEIEQ